MSYEPIFDSGKLADERGPEPGKVGYHYTDKLELAINVALATGRPLLLSGKAGTGKSTVAADIAWKLKRNFFSEVITSRTQAQDLQWSFDSVRRLSEAMAAEDVTDVARFVKKGVLWRAFTESAADREHAVVLLDEIDKAEPDVPNDLLVVLDQREFTVRETREEVKAGDVKVLVVITTNGERDLPPAFLRRCITHELGLHLDVSDDDPKRDEKIARRDEWMQEIARRHCDRLVIELTPKKAKAVPISNELLGGVYRLYLELRSDTASRNLRQPSTAEMVDAFRACATMGMRDVGDGPWKQVAASAMWKHPTKEPGEQG